MEHQKFVDQIDALTKSHRDAELILKMTQQLDASAGIRDDVLKMNSVYDRVARDLSKVHDIAKTFDTSALVGFRDSVAALSLPTDVFASAKRSLEQLALAQDQIAGISKYFQTANDQIASITKLATIDTTALDAIRADVARISLIAEPIPSVQKLFAEATEAIRSHANLFDAARLVDEGIIQSLKPIGLTNDFFRQPYAIPDFAILHDAPTSKDDEQIESTPARVVHRTTADVVIAGNDMAKLLATEIERTLDEKLEEHFKAKFGPYVALFDRIKQLSEPGSLGAILRQFGTTFARNYWRDLWDEPGDEFKRRPESLARAMLGMYMEAQYQGIAFVGQELRNGAGFIDLLVHYLGADFVVELKMLGGGYGYQYALDGADQLDEYLENYHQREGYLVIFDGRKTDSGKTFPAEIVGKHGKITVIVVRCYFEGPTTKK